jgi:hypothetical protein
MTRTKDKIVEHMNAPNQHAIDLKEEIDSQTRTWEWRLVAAQAAMSRVVKDSRVAFGNQRYAYTSAEDMIGACREALLSAGLALTRSWDIVHSEHGTVVLSHFSLHHTNGTVSMGSCPFPVIGQNGKGEDKSVATALTSSLAYFLRDLLMVPKEDDAQQMVKAPEMDARDDRTQTGAQVIGVPGTLALLRKLKAANATVAEVVEVMAKAGLHPPENLEQWPRTLLPRIDKWLEKRVATVDSGKISDSPQQAAGVEA